VGGSATRLQQRAGEKALQLGTTDESRRGARANGQVRLRRAAPVQAARVQRVMSDKRAIILAGGVGRRLAPFTFVIPKPIVPIGTVPILEIVLRQLGYYGFRRMTIALGHMSEIVRAVAGDGSRFGVQIDYSDEPKPLGTMGPLARIPDLPGTFLVMNADLLCDIDYEELWSFHRQHGGIATV